MKSGIYKAIVKDNTDKTGNGRVRLYIPSLGGDPTDENIWYTATPMSPQAGSTNPYENTKGGKTAQESQESYGTWATGYHKENELLVTFMNGDPKNPIIVGASFGQNMTHSVAGYPAGRSHQGTTRGVHPPTVEYNKRDEEINPRAPIRPRRALLSQQLKKQGLYRDGQRGQMSTSPHRDEVPQFSSMKTPRGNAFIMDDGKLDPNAGSGRNEREYSHTSTSHGYIRAKTSRGAQLYINDNCGFVYMNTADGNAFLQVADNAISMYSASNISMRAKSSFSLRVDGNYNLEVLGTTTMKATGKFAINSTGDFNIHDNGSGVTMNTAGDYNVKSGENLSLEAGGDHSEKAGGNIVEDSGGNLHENTVTPAAVADAMEIIPASATDRAPAGCNAQGQTDSSLPSGSMVTHEPTSTHGGSCGYDGGAPGLNCGPSVDQELGDGTTSSSDANPPDECGNAEEGEQDDPQALNEEAMAEEEGHDEEGHDHDHDAEFVEGARNPNLDNVNPELVDKVRAASSEVGMDEIPFNSGTRDTGHNASVGGASGSQHLPVNGVGNAIDIGVGHMSQQQRINYIQALADQGITGIGVYNNAIHADLRNGPKAAWGPNYSYSSTPSWARDVLIRNGYNVGKPGF